VDSVSADDLTFTDELDFRQVIKNPILDIAARLWEDERYEAFKTCYHSMRAIDDLVDGVKSQDGTLSEAERGRLASRISEWVRAIEEDQLDDVNRRRLAETLEKFRIPLWP
jgi:phytoene/squalene synthetase